MLVLVIYNVTHMINHAVGGILFKRHRDQMITKCLCNLFQPYNEFVGLVWLVLAIYSVLFMQGFM